MTINDLQKIYDFHIISESEIQYLRQEGNPSYVIIKDGETFKVARVPLGFNEHPDDYACLNCKKRMLSVPTEYGGCDKVYYSGSGIEKFPFIERGIEILGQNRSLFVVKCKDIDKNN